MPAIQRDFLFHPEIEHPCHHPLGKKVFLKMFRRQHVQSSLNATDLRPNLIRRAVLIVDHQQFAARQSNQPVKAPVDRKPRSQPELELLFHPTSSPRGYWPTLENPW